MTTRDITTVSRFLGAIAAVALALVAATPTHADSANCSFVSDLEDSTQRSLYLTQIARFKAAATSRFGEFLVESVQFVTRSGERVEIDQISFYCISCHDGTSAPDHNSRFKSGDGRDSTGIIDVVGSHPIGMHYGNAAYSRQGLKGLDQLHEDIVLVNGRVGCLSCHNPLNRDAKHLVVSSEQDNLCFACHSN